MPDVLRQRPSFFLSRDECFYKERDMSNHLVYCYVNDLFNYVCPFLINKPDWKLVLIASSYHQAINYDMINWNVDIGTHGEPNQKLFQTCEVSSVSEDVCKWSLKLDTTQWITLNDANDVWHCYEIKIFITNKGPMPCQRNSTHLKM